MKTQNQSNKASAPETRTCDYIQKQISEHKYVPRATMGDLPEGVDSDKATIIDETKLAEVTSQRDELLAALKLKLQRKTDRQYIANLIAKYETQH